MYFLYYIDLYSGIRWGFLAMDICFKCLFVLIVCLLLFVICLLPLFAWSGWKIVRTYIIMFRFLLKSIKNITDNLRFLFAILSCCFSFQIVLYILGINCYPSCFPFGFSIVSRQQLWSSFCKLFLIGTTILGITVMYRLSTDIKKTHITLYF